MSFLVIDIVQSLWYGLVIGSILALGGMGISLTFSVARFSNFAHGEVVACGAYTTLLVYTILGLPLWVAIITSMVVVAGVSWLLERTFFRPLRHRSAVTLLISSFGAAFVLRSLIQLGFGPQIRSFSNTIVPSLRIGEIRMQTTQIVVVVVAIIASLGVYVILKHTTIGRWLRAVADNPSLASLCGVPTDMIRHVTWLMAGVLAALTGIALGFESRLQPDMGIQILLPLFAAAIVGGLGHPLGAIVGGLLVGITQEMAVLVITPAYKPAVAFAIVVLTLLLRPHGVMGRR